jgi:hypothetical protein
LNHNPELASLGSFWWLIHHPKLPTFHLEAENTSTEHSWISHVKHPTRGDYRNPLSPCSSLAFGRVQFPSPPHPHPNLRCSDSRHLPSNLQQSNDSLGTSWCPAKRTTIITSQCHKSHHHMQLKALGIRPATLSAQPSKLYSGNVT